MEFENSQWILLFIAFIISCTNTTADIDKEINKALKYIDSQLVSNPPPGMLVDLGGYKLHLFVEGEESQGPTVVFFHGAGDSALNWNLVLPKVGKFAKAIVID